MLSDIHPLARPENKKDTPQTIKT